MKKILFVLTVLISSTPAFAASPDIRVSRATSDITVDGLIEEPAWAAAIPIPLDYEWLPGDNIRPPVRTEAYVTYDDRNVYVAFKAWDPDPRAIRANLMDRDSIDTFVQDDHVTFMIDPFNDARRAFQFRVNPRGVQADAMFSQVEGVEDFSWDIIWSSAARIDGEGWTMEAAVPLNQIRFPAGAGEQTWGIEFGRSYPRDVRHRISANRRDRNNNCLLCQVTKVSGFSGLHPGRNLEVDPTLTATQTEARESFPSGDFTGDAAEIEPGITGRWGFRPSMTANLTLNPDFSQVEADAIQLDVNQRFALFYEEKRPFFLEGVDLFSTPVNVVFTRTVADPRWGLKVTGKEGRHAGGVFVTEDRVNNLLIPSNEGSAYATVNESVLGSVLRYRQDLGPDAQIGVLYAGREGDGYHNRLAAFDGFFRPSQTDRVRLQFLRSDTKYPGEVAAAFDQSSSAFAGNGIRVDYGHDARNWQWALNYEDLSPDFRADSGFVPRVGYREGRASLTRNFWPDEGSFINSWNVRGVADRVEDHDGQMTDRSYELTATLNGPMQSVLQTSVEQTAVLFGGTLYDDLLETWAYFEIQPGAVTKFTFFALDGDTVDYANNQPATQTQLEPTAELKLGRHVNAQLSHIYQALDVSAGRLSTANISQLRFVYNFSVRSFVRAVIQRRNVSLDPSLFSAPVEPLSNQVFTQLLFSYKVNPQTVFFLGYSDNYLGLENVSLTQTDRTLFAKIGYAWIF